ncbi:hypothetical protein DPEC_G00055730 [Dallia pectoralis]|uniref:Uncharacterized protein n=1 Tax=Dallia pectoralis TaxID=75939 RepID=A0ACC2H5E7_DALPE|nr:hypothetical protein DPEC_G00055730 [Dallia pectoralis]
MKPSQQDSQNRILTIPFEEYAKTWTTIGTTKADSYMRNKSRRPKKTDPSGLGSQECVNQMKNNKQPAWQNTRHADTRTKHAEALPVHQGPPQSSWQTATQPVGDLDGAAGGLDTMSDKE